MSSAGKFHRRSIILHDPDKESKPDITENVELGSTGEPDEVRDKWTGKFDFLLSLLGYSVGLGNVWRFPYLAYSNGGGVFLLPFLVMLLLVGFPLMFMELAFGQFASLGPIAIFERFCPLFKGLGYGMLIVSGLVAFYYNMLLAWTLFYMFASFTRELPWQRCDPDWSSSSCYSYLEADRCHEVQGQVYFNGSCFNRTEVGDINITQHRTLPAQEYFENYMLGMSRGIEELGSLRWQLALCLLLAWTIIFLCLARGIKSSGKVVYFTALFPYLVLLILFFRGITLPGAGQGILFYLKPDFQKLTTAKVWCDAAVQIFFSLSPAWGGLITLASYNKFNNDCFKDALIVSVSNISTSIFAGFVIFSIVGYLAKELDQNVGDVIKQGAGLAFIVYPEVVTRLPISPFWSILFFIMLLTLGLDSMFALLETVITALMDKFPDLRKKKARIVLLLCLIGYVGGLIICTQGGMYILQLMDAYAASWSVFLLAITESILIGWVYGADRFLGDIESMLGKKGQCFHRFFNLFWKFLSPATLLFLMIFNWVQYRPLTLGDYEFPWQANLIGWLMSLASLAAIPILAVTSIYAAKGKSGIWQTMKVLMLPTADWGPTLAETSKPFEEIPLESTQAKHRYDGTSVT